MKMIMHAYKCNGDDCNQEHKLFLTWFPPIYEEPAHCPNCGSSELVKCVGVAEVDL